MQRQIASGVLENVCENLCLRNRILSLQQVAKNQIRLNLCDLLRRQILLQRQRFSQKFSSTHEAICHCNVLLRHVAATCCLVCTDLNRCKCLLAAFLSLRGHGVFFCGFKAERQETHNPGHGIQNYFLF